MVYIRYVYICTHTHIYVYIYSFLHGYLTGGNSHLADECEIYSAKYCMWIFDLDLKVKTKVLQLKHLNIFQIREKYIS